MVEGAVVVVVDTAVAAVDTVVVAVDMAAEVVIVTQAWMQ